MQEQGDYTYYHNPRCSKSQEGLEILKQSGIKFKVKEYLSEPLTIEELIGIFRVLKTHPKNILRQSEKIYSELNLGDLETTSSDWAQLIAEHPILLERPILIGKEDGVIGRPPGKIQDFLA